MTPAYAPCRFHGGPIEGREIMLSPRCNRVQVPVAVETWGARMTTADTTWGEMYPQIHLYIYAVSVERWPVPPTGMTLIAYPAVSP